MYQKFRYRIAVFFAILFITIVSAPTIILSIDDNEILEPNDLNIILKKYKAGDKVVIKYLRNNKIKTSDLILGSYKNK